MRMVVLSGQQENVIVILTLEKGKLNKMKITEEEMYCKENITKAKIVAYVIIRNGHFCYANPISVSWNDLNQGPDTSNKLENNEEIIGVVPAYNDYVIWCGCKTCYELSGVYKPTDDEIIEEAKEKHKNWLEEIKLLKEMKERENDQ